MEANTLIGEAMKFIINGRTFDTASSTKAAIFRGVAHEQPRDFLGNSEMRFEDTLYRTAKGAFFVHEHRTEKMARGGKPIVTDVAKELTPEQAVAWIIKERAIVLDATGLDLPEEA